MKKNKTILGAAAIALLLAAGIATTAYAYQGDYSKQGPAYSPERHAAMTSAFANNDYAAWLEQMAGRGRVTQVINADNFSKFAEANRLAQTGDVAGADAIRTELGLRASDGAGIGAGNRKGAGMKNGGGNRGAGRGAAYVDANGDGICDNMQ